MLDVSSFVAVAVSEDEGSEDASLLEGVALASTDWVLDTSLLEALAASDDEEPEDTSPLVAVGVAEGDD